MKRTLQQILNEIPDVEEEYNRNRARKINKLNKDRSRRMERKVAEILNGDRIPMSGSGSMKGDVRVESPFGLILVECKLSAAIHSIAGPTIRIRNEWLKKITEEAIHTSRARFGILVVKFHDINPMYAMIPYDVYYSTLFPGEQTPQYVYDTSEKSRETFQLYYRKILLHLGDTNSILYTSPSDGTWILIPLVKLKERFEQESERLGEGNYTQS